MNWTKQWEKDRRALKEEFFEKGITTCEIGRILRGMGLIAYSNCWKNNALGFAHRHKRDWYKDREREGLLGAFNEVLLACNPCHDIIEDDKELTDNLFLHLRYGRRLRAAPLRGGEERKGTEVTIQTPNEFRAEEYRSKSTP